MALGSTVKTGSKTASKVVKSAARMASRNPAITAIGQLSPDELASPSVQRMLARMGITSGPQGFSGFVNGGPLAADFARPGVGFQQAAIPAVTGGPYPGPASVASAEGAAQSAAARGAAQVAAVEAPTVAAAAPAVASTAATAPQYGRIGGMLAWNPTAARAAAQAGLTGTELAAASRPGMFAAGSLGRGLGYGAAGYIGANLLHGVVGERDAGPGGLQWDDAAEGALKGAGIGAGIGSVVPVIGTGIGAGVGALVGGAWGALTGNDSPGTERDKYLAQQFDPNYDKGVVSLMNKYGLSPEAQRQLRVQIEAIAPQLGSKDEAKQLVMQVMSNLPQLLQEDEAQKAQASRAAAMQAYLLPMMRDSQAQTEQFMQQQYALVNDSASRMSPSVASIYRQHALDTLASNSRANQAMYSQMLLAPQLYQQSAQYGLPNPAAAAGQAVYSPTG